MSQSAGISSEMMKNCIFCGEHTIALQIRHCNWCVGGAITADHFTS